MFMVRLAHCGGVLAVALLFGYPPAPEGLLPGSRQTLKLPEQNILSLTADRDGVATIGTSGTQLFRWDPRQGKSRPLDLGTRPDLLGGTIALTPSPQPGRLLVGGTDNKVRVVDTAKNEVVQTLEGHRGPVWSVLYFRDGKRAVSGSTSDYSIRVWDLERGVEQATFSNKEMVNGLALSPDEKLLATTEMFDVVIWDLATRRRVAVLASPRGSRLYGLAWLPNGSILAVDSFGKCKIWSDATYKVLREFQIPNLFVRSVAIHPDGELLAVGGLNAAVVVDGRDGTELKRWEKLDGNVYAAFAGDGTSLFLAEQWGLVHQIPTEAIRPKK